MLYCGGGIISGNASEELREFAEATQIPVTTTIMGCGAFPKRIRSRCAGSACTAPPTPTGPSTGIQAASEVNEPMEKITHGADLLLAFGVRFDDRVTGKVEKFCEHGTIVHIDIDASEHQQEQARAAADR